MLDLTCCPDGVLGAGRGVDRFVLASTAELVEHLRLQCANRHWFVVLAERWPPRHRRRRSRAERREPAH